MLFQAAGVLDQFVLVFFFKLYLPICLGERKISKLKNDYDFCIFVIQSPFLSMYDLF